MTIDEVVDHINSDKVAENWAITAYAGSARVIEPAGEISAEDVGDDIISVEMVTARGVKIKTTIKLDTIESLMANHGFTMQESVEELLMFGRATP